MTGGSKPPPGAKVVHSTMASRIGVAFWIVLVAVLIAIPYWRDRQAMRLLTEIYSFVALASLWNLLAGYAGLVSVGQQAFVGLGGYTLYLCALWAGVNPMLGLPLAGLLGGLISIPIVVLLLKLRGAYFTIGSWVVAELFLQIFQLVPAVGGGSGISLPATVVLSIAKSRSTRESVIYWIFLALAVAVIGVIVILLRTRYGLALQAIRDNETAAKSNGIDVNRARAVVFVVAAAATAIVGSMIFLQKLSITPFSAFSINDWTVNMIFITVIGGVGRVEGPILGTVIYFVLRELGPCCGPVRLAALSARPPAGARRSAARRTRRGARLAGCADRVRNRSDWLDHTFTLWWSRFRGCFVPGKSLVHAFAVIASLPRGGREAQHHGRRRGAQYQPTGAHPQYSPIGKDDRGAAVRAAANRRGVDQTGRSAGAARQADGA